MKYSIIATIFIIGILTTYETEHIVDEEGLIIASEGVAIAQQQDKPLPPDFFAPDVIENGLCFVGQTFTIKATLKNMDRMFALGIATFETNRDSVFFTTDATPLFEFLDLLECRDYYKEGGTYTFTIYIEGIGVYRADDPAFHRVIKFHEGAEGRGRRREAFLFEIWSSIIITEDLVKELKAAGCWLIDNLAAQRDGN